MGVPASSTVFDYDPSSLSLAVKIAHSDIKSLSRIDLATDIIAITQDSPEEETMIGKRKSTVSSIMRRKSKSIFAKNSKHKSHIEGNQAILIETSSEVFKFFPFMETEAESIVNYLSDITKLTSLSLADYQSRISSKIKSRDRQTALEALCKESNPWIETTEALTECILSLTKESNDFSFINLERIYHSCRLEKKVTFETISCLKVF
jgi:hypothetical protein